ncbi:ScpA family protein [soil metagenome]
MTTDTAPMTLASYQLRLPSFEGPLDVLLSLIEREKLDISDLSLVTVTDGFLAHIDALEDATPRLLADFLGVAARLLVLKSRALLPRPEVHEAVEDVDDLAEQLREYQRMRNVANGLGEAQVALWRSYSRSAPPVARPTRMMFVLPPVAHLGRALVRAIARQPAEPEPVLMRRVVSVAEMAGRLLAAITASKRSRRFVDLVSKTDREETVAGFIALLALWRRRQIDVQQDGLFAVIMIEPVSAGEGTTP